MLLCPEAKQTHGGVSNTVLCKAGLLLRSWSSANAWIVPSLSGTFQAHTGVSGHWMPMSWNQTITVLSILEMSIFKKQSATLQRILVAFKSFSTRMGLGWWIVQEKFCPSTPAMFNSQFHWSAITWTVESSHGHDCPDTSYWLAVERMFQSNQFT